MRARIRQLSRWGLLVLAASALGFASGHKSPGAAAAHPFAQKVRKPAAAAKIMADGAALRAEQQLVVERLNEWRQGLTAQSFSGATAQQNDAVAELAQISERTLRIHWEKTTGTPIFISGKRLQSSAKLSAAAISLQTASDRAMNFLRDNKQLLRLGSPAEELVRMSSERDNLGMIHIRYQQVYRDLEIWGRDVVVHLNRDGQVETFNGRYVPTPVSLGDAETSITEAAACATAEREFGKMPREVYSRRLIYVDDQNGAHVAWLVNLKGALDENWYYFIDARNGSVLHHYNHVLYDGPIAGSGLDLDNQTRSLNVYQIGANFYLIDTSKPMFDATASKLPNEGKGVIYAFDARNGEGQQLYYVTASSATAFDNKPGVSAAANGALVYDYYRQLHIRNAIDDKGTTMNLAVNFKTNFNNAFWNGTFMVFGNGDGDRFRDLAASYDVAAHEMTHGVVEHTANLVYENQPGALNESFADVFGTLFEFYTRPATANYLLGEDVTTPNIAGDCLRNMEDPAAANVAFGGQQPTKMSEYRNLPNTNEGDHGGVHINSGIPNRAFVIIAKAIGNAKAEQIYYRALKNYLTRTSQFIDARLAVVKAAEDLHGAGSTEANACKSAFDTVEILEGSGTPPPQPQDPVQGKEYLAVVSAADLSLNLIDLTAGTGGMLTATPVRLFSRPTVSDNGSTIFFVDSNNFIRVIGSDGQGEQVISSQGIWNSIALSPDGTKLAATTTSIDTTIYVIDLVNSANSKAYKLYTPTYSQGVATGNALFADALEWASDSQTLMYDAFNFSVDSNGDTLPYWDINLLRASDGLINRLFPPQPTGVSVGNPVFASNSDFIMALDYVDPDGNVTVYGINLNTGAVAQITFNFSSPGRPTFSRDDKRVYYHYVSGSMVETWFVDLLADGITGNGQDQRLFENYYLPLDFAVGSRPTDVEEKPETRPLVYALHQNYPNPFNPETAIRYALPFAGQVQLSVYDLTGRLVATIESGLKTAGEHVGRWNGRDSAGQRVASGVYFYRLKATSPTGASIHLTRKMTVLR